MNNPKDLTVSELKEAIRKTNDAELIKELGFRYYFGKDVNKNLEGAILLWKKAAEAGNAVAQYRLASLYASGEGVEQDGSKALQWLEKSAKQGEKSCPDAQFELGRAYFYGWWGLTPNREEAASLFEKAANSNHIEAQYMYALICDKVYGDPEESLRWLKKIIANDPQNVSALISIGDFYYRGKAGGQPDYKQGFLYYEKADEADKQCEQGGKGNAQYNLAMCYVTGEGIERDIKKAISLAKESAEKGCVEGEELYQTLIKMRA